MSDNNNGLNIDEIKITKDMVEVQYRDDKTAIFMEEFIKFFNSFGGENYVSFSISSDTHAYAITIENLMGKKSPADRIKELETKVCQLTLELQQLREKPSGIPFDGNILGKR